MIKRGAVVPLSKQMKRAATKEVEEDEVYKGNFDTITSSGSTLLDLAISGGRIRGGGFPGGIVVEAFGPSQSGKTVLLSEIAGGLQRSGADVQFHDPEARLDQEFASLFGMRIPADRYFMPDTVTEFFTNARKWKPKGTAPVNGIFGDSLAALSTNMEMDDEDGDKMGTRRAKEFSEQLRKFCRILKRKNYLMVCSNQIRTNIDAANKFSPKWVVPGGHAFEFYSSVRLKFNTPEKITKKIEIHDKTVSNVIGIETEVEVIKSVDSPYRKAPLIIIYGYGIDDIRANLQYIKTYTGATGYYHNDMRLGKSIEEAIHVVEGDKELTQEIKDHTIDLWEEIQEKFKTNRVKIR